ncbi:MAG: adenylate kinase [Anaerolineae bacterium]
MDIVLLGAPGAGKGTQAELLNTWLGLPRLSTGDLFRAQMEAGTPLGRKAKEYIDKGNLVPDSVTIAMVADRLREDDCAEGVLFDGFPRTVAQAEALDGILDALGRKVDLVAYVQVSVETLLRRLSGRATCTCGAVYHREFSPEKVPGICDVCGRPLQKRSDDTPETQMRRIQVYMEQTTPLIAHYRAKGLLAEIDGEQSVDAVYRALRSAIESRLTVDRGDAR